MMLLMGLLSSCATPAVRVPNRLQLVCLHEQLLPIDQLVHHVVHRHGQLGELVVILLLAA